MSEENSKKQEGSNGQASQEERLEEHKQIQWTNITIPVNYKIEGGQAVISYDELEKYLREAKFLYQWECGCRQLLIKDGNETCKDPMDGCFSILEEEKPEYAEKYNAHPVSVEKALEAMKRTHEAGLVHMMYISDNKEKQGDQICSCCSCCCDELGKLAKTGFHDQVVQSKYIAIQHIDLCDNCGVCADRCQFGARKMDGVALVYNSEDCFGCGVCAPKCPTDAIEMVERE